MYRGGGGGVLSTRNGEDMGSRGCPELEPASCGPALCPYSPFHPQPERGDFLNGAGWNAQQGAVEGHSRHSLPSQRTLWGTAARL